MRYAEGGGTKPRSTDVQLSDISLAIIVHMTEKDSYFYLVVMLTFFYKAFYLLNYLF